jgi:hypothetical protein
MKMASRIEGARVWPVSGPLEQVFRKVLQPAEYHECELLLKYKGRMGYQVRAIKEFTMGFERRAVIPAGSEFWISEQEYKSFEVQQNVKLLDTELCL